MMFGGSPTRAAAPPILEAKTSAIRNGDRTDAEALPEASGVTGQIRRTVVTLSSRAEATAVIRTSRIITRSAGPAWRAASPDGVVLPEDTGPPEDTGTITTRRATVPMTFQSTPVSAGAEHVNGTGDPGGDDHRGGAAECAY